ncbi:hypothetical protein A6V25_20595 [Nostoc sp. ATCC 53789]|nr:hypothetical protein A6V25_20595 [Nostoc sp. ATCC 53789]
MNQQLFRLARSDLISLMIDDNFSFGLFFVSLLSCKNYFFKRTAKDAFAQRLVREGREVEEKDREFHILIRTAT